MVCVCPPGESDGHDANRERMGNMFPCLFMWKFSPLRRGRTPRTSKTPEGRSATFGVQGLVFFLMFFFFFHFLTSRPLFSFFDFSDVFFFIVFCNCFSFFILFFNFFFIFHVFFTCVSFHFFLVFFLLAFLFILSGSLHSGRPTERHGRSRHRPTKVFECVKLILRP